MKFPTELKDREELIRKWSQIVDLGQDIKTWTSLAELCWLCELASQSSYICEIGSYHGRSALCMAMANPDLKILAIDNCENGEVPGEFKRNLAAPIREGRVVFEKATSLLLKSYKPLNLDAVWIDAGHLRDDVFNDILYSKDHVRVGGIVCGHDWRENDMKDGVNLAVMDSLKKPDGVFESLWWKTV